MKTDELRELVEGNKVNLYPTGTTCTITGGGYLPTGKEATYAYPCQTGVCSGHILIDKTGTEWCAERDEFWAHTRINKHTRATASVATGQHAGGARCILFRKSSNRHGELCTIVKKSSVSDPYNTVVFEDGVFAKYNDYYLVPVAAPASTKHTTLVLTEEEKVTLTHALYSRMEYLNSLVEELECDARNTESEKLSKSIRKTAEFYHTIIKDTTALLDKM